jgi:hypothetical protein
MTTNNRRKQNWPRRRLVIRSIISSTLPIGWTWAALTALIPYFWIGHGAGTSAETLLGATRATWLSLHVWSSITIAILTIAHMLLNRRGVARSYRVVSGAPNKASSVTPSRRGFAWAGVLLLAAISIGGGYWFASVDDSHSPGNNRQITVEQDAALDGGGLQSHGNGGG